MDVCPTHSSANVCTQECTWSASNPHGCLATATSNSEHVQDELRGPQSHFWCHMVSTRVLDLVIEARTTSQPAIATTSASSCLGPSSHREALGNSGLPHWVCAQTPSSVFQKRWSVGHHPQGETQVQKNLLWPLAAHVHCALFAKKSLRERRVEKGAHSVQPVCPRLHEPARFRRPHASIPSRRRSTVLCNPSRTPVGGHFHWHPMTVLLPGLALF